MEAPRDDIELWNAFRQGDETAFSMLYRRHIRILYRYGHKIVSDTRVVEDAIQDLFADLWNSRENLGDTDSVKYYMFRVLRRKVGKNLKYFEGVELPDEEFFPGFDSADSREKEIIEKEQNTFRIQSLQNAIQSLPERQREIISLRYFHEFSHREIAGIMGITLQSVHNLLQKSTKSLRGLLTCNVELLLIISSCPGAWKQLAESYL